VKEWNLHKRQTGIWQTFGLENRRVGFSQIFNGELTVLLVTYFMVKWLNTSACDSHPLATQPENDDKTPEIYLQEPWQGQQLKFPWYFSQDYHVNMRIRGLVGCLQCLYENPNHN
jgi:hypothetical protein